MTSQDDSIIWVNDLNGIGTMTERVIESVERGGSDELTFGEAESQIERSSIISDCRENSRGFFDII